MNPATIALLSVLGIFIISKIIGYITNKPKNIVVIPPKNGAKERKKDGEFVDDVVLLDMVDEDTNYNTTLEIME